MTGGHDGARGRRRHRSAHRQVPARTAPSALMQGHNLPMAVMGTFVLAFGWFGFNAGSTLAATESRIAERRREHGDRLGHGRAHGALLRVAAAPQARRRDGVQRHARRARGDHGAVRVRRPRRPPRSSASSPGLLVALGRPRRSRRRMRIDDPVGAIAVHGALRRLGHAGRRALRRRELRRGLERRRRARCAASSSATPASSWRRSSASLTNGLFVFCGGLRLLLRTRSPHRQPRRRRSRVDGPRRGRDGIRSLHP